MDQTVKVCNSTKLNSRSNNNNDFWLVGSCNAKIVILLFFIILFLVTAQIIKDNLYVPTMCLYYGLLVQNNGLLDLFGSSYYKQRCQFVEEYQHESFLLNYYLNSNPKLGDGRHSATDKQHKQQRQQQQQQNSRRLLLDDPDTQHKIQKFETEPWARIPKSPDGLMDEPRSFLLEESRDFYQTQTGMIPLSFSSSSLSTVGRKQSVEVMVEEQFMKTLCGPEIQPSKDGDSHVINSCRDSFRLMRCVTCITMGSSWFTGVSNRGYISGSVAKRTRSDMIMEFEEEDSDSDKKYNNDVNNNRLIQDSRQRRKDQWSISLAPQTPLLRNHNSSSNKDNNYTARFTSIDICIPAACIEDKLKQFAHRNMPRLVKNLQGFTAIESSWPGLVDIRLLITRYPCDVKHKKQDNHEESTAEAALRQELTNLATLPNRSTSNSNTTTASTTTSGVVFVHVEPKEGSTIDFNRAQAINSLLRVARSEYTNLVIVMDVDMVFSMEYVENAMALVHPHKSVYFPITWSEYKPSSALAVSQFYADTHEYPANQEARDNNNNNRKKNGLSRFSTHFGFWRTHGFGMFAMAGPDAHALKMDDSFEGWGGEDNAFVNRVSALRNVVRMKEYGLVHRWHSKHCDPGKKFVAPKQLQACIGSLAIAEGSNLGMLLRSEIEGTQFLSGSTNSISTQSSPDKYLVERARKRIQLLQPRLLIGVLVSRQGYAARVDRIKRTWARGLPDEIVTFYFVGASVVPDSDRNIRNETEENHGASGKTKGDVDSDSTNTVFLSTMDMENPPINKKVETIRWMDAFAHDTTIKWIMIVHDDTYVNVPFLVEITLTKQQQQWHQESTKKQKQPPPSIMIGVQVPPHNDKTLERGARTPITSSSYCLGEAGIVFDRQSFHVLASNIEPCMDTADQLPWREQLWNADALVGFCVQRELNVGCTEEKTHSGVSYFRPFDSGAVIVDAGHEDLSKTLTVYSVGGQEDMDRLHNRFISQHKSHIIS